MSGEAIIALVVLSLGVLGSAIHLSYQVGSLKAVIMQELQQHRGTLKQHDRRLGALEGRPHTRPAAS